MDPFHEIINLSDEDGYDSDGSSYNLERDFLLHNNEIQNDVEAMNIAQIHETTPSGIRNPLDSYESCLKEIVEVFPDISHDHVQQIYNQHMGVPGLNQRQEGRVAPTLVEKILDGGNYPKERDRIRELKRKRSDKDADEEEAAKWKYLDLRDGPTEYAKVARVALQEAFERVPIKFIQDKFKEHSHYYGAFFAVLKAEREYNPPSNVPFSRLRAPRVSNGPTSKTLMAQFQEAGFDFEALKKEMDSALVRRKREDEQIKSDEDAELLNVAKEEQCIVNGEVMDCGCCCETVTLPRLTYCNGDEPHFFCLDCARRNANNDIGNSQYKLKCMDFSDCNATFSREQRLRFLDEKTMEKLERLQQQEDLRLAELDNLSTCPFCDFAAICPPIEEDREFRCYNPECEEISCRLCKLISHIPLSCKEHKKENAISERRVIEEARTEALIRTCNKCKVRILKEDGCNKVVCTSCYAVLCDYCGKDITKAMYNHFETGSGRAPPGLITTPGGNCPLYDESNKRKDEQVDAAEKEAMAKVRVEHPELSEEDLKIKFAKGVQQPSDRHRRPHHAWVPPPYFPHQPNGIEDPAPQFGPRFDPRLANAQANAMAPMPGVFPGVNEDQGLQQLRQQRQAAYHAHLKAQQELQQAQQRREQELQQTLQRRQQQLQQAQQRRHQELQQAQQRRQQAEQQVLQLRTQQQFQQLQAQQQAQLTRQFQNNLDENRPPNLRNQAPNRESLFGDGMLLGANGAFGADANGRLGNDDLLAFNPFNTNDFPIGPNQPARRAFGPNNRLPAERPTSHREPEARFNVAYATRLAQFARHQEQRQQPRPPMRRNAVADYNLHPGQGNPWM